ncbi:hypothetical protein DFH07DRAFT_1056314 [Mycena maculata]|uniref:RING-type domain-containing protein n=1 Tax=Mycena maculata TaxID=230809 RepID=A0AAD7NWD0_9AGAR|nr:hypothetical protein DFH07DRAFT_1056314 [Mycena maculata]
MSSLANECLIIALASAGNALGLNLLQISKTTLAGVLAFCKDVLALPLYAILSALALAAVFLGLTAWSSLILFYQDSTESLARRWIDHTWTALHTTRLAGTSPLALFLATSLPALLSYARIHQARRAVVARQSEISKQLAAEQTVIREQDPPKQLAQEVQAIHASLKCTLCALPFQRPYTIAPCGHTFDLACLQRFFHRAPPTPLDTRLARVDLTAREKRCPLLACRAAVPAPPARAWAVQAVAAAVDPDPCCDEDSAPAHPWEGIFEVDLRRRR